MLKCCWLQKKIMLNTLSITFIWFKSKFYILTCHKIMYKILIANVYNQFIARCYIMKLFLKGLKPTYVDCRNEKNTVISRIGA